MTELPPCERAAFFVLLKRQPLFKWERMALTERALTGLEQKGLIVRDGSEWRITELGRHRAGRSYRPK